MYQDKSLAVSYAIFILIVIAVGAFHLTTVFVTILFASLAFVRSPLENTSGSRSACS